MEKVIHILPNHYISTGSNTYKDEDLVYAQCEGKVYVGALKVHASQEQYSVDNKHFGIKDNVLIKKANIKNLLWYKLEQRKPK